MKRFLLLLVATSLPFVQHAQARVAGGPGLIDRGAPDCLQIPPEESPALATSTSEPLELHARFLFEKGDGKAVKDYVAVTADAFERIGIEVVATYDRVTPPREWKTNDSFSGDAGSDEQFAFIKEHYGGLRPAGTDVVYYFSRYWSGGMADCIGGVRWPDLAFAIGSIDYYYEGTVPAPTVNEGVIAAHEIGHLLGAHHHYSNCAEAAPRGALAGQPGACTVMSPLATTASTVFGLMETSFVRHHLSKYGTAHS